MLPFFKELVRSLITTSYVHYRCANHDIDQEMLENLLRCYSLDCTNWLGKDLWIKGEQIGYNYN